MSGGWWELQDTWQAGSWQESHAEDCRWQANAWQVDGSVASSQFLGNEEGLASANERWNRSTTAVSNPDVQHDRQLEETTDTTWQSAGGSWWSSAVDSSSEPWPSWDEMVASGAVEVTQAQTARATVIPETTAWHSSLDAECFTVGRTQEPADTVAWCEATGVALEVGQNDRIITADDQRHGQEVAGVIDDHRHQGAVAEKVLEAQSDAQMLARWRDFRNAQEWYKEKGILPGKSPEDVEIDDKELFVDNMEDEGVDFGLYDLVPCDVCGPNTEHMPHINTFEELFLMFKDYIPSQVELNIRRCGFNRPTPVQKYAIPVALTGRDVMCSAQTGSGKTAAFLVPVLASMVKHHRATGAMNVSYENACKPDTMILSPTRELCLQIYKDALRLVHRTPFRIVRTYGQESARNQILELARGADVLIATPGRLWDFVHSGIVNVKEVNCLVIDEADRMIAQGMECWIRSIVEQHGMPSRHDRQTMLFSATFPEEIQRMGADYLYDHVWIGVGVVGGAASTVKQVLLKVDPSESAKNAALLSVLTDFLNKRRNGDRCMVFSNSKRSVRSLHDFLCKSGIRTLALHGDLLQYEREENLRRFREDEVDVLVATDLASRGLDIGGVRHVVNYDVPYEIEAYVQRIGRTGRIGHRGEATTFIGVESNGSFADERKLRHVLVKLAGIMEDANSEVPDWLSEYVRPFCWAWNEQPNSQPIWQ